MAVPAHAATWPVPNEADAGATSREPQDGVRLLARLTIASRQIEVTHSTSPGPTVPADHGDRHGASRFRRTDHAVLRLSHSWESVSA